MRIHKKYFLSLLLAASTGNAAWQDISYKTDACDCKAKFNPSVISPEQAADSLALATGSWEYPGHSFSGLGPACRAGQRYPIEERESLRHKLEDTLAYLKNMKLVPALEPYRAQQIHSTELLEFLTLARLDYERTGNAAILTADYLSRAQPALCKELVGASQLSDEAQLISQWENVEKQRCETRKSDPPQPQIYEACLYNLKNDTKDIPQEHNGKCMALTFGWYNCALEAFSPKTPLQEEDALAAMKPFLHQEKCDCDEAD